MGLASPARFASSFHRAGSVQSTPGIRRVSGRRFPRWVIHLWGIPPASNGVPCLEEDPIEGIDGAEGEAPRYQTGIREPRTTREREGCRSHDTFPDLLFRLVARAGFEPATSGL
jgi:hypothetical protein